jgi:outer membrane protein, heavy metal efflux system
MADTFGTQRLITPIRSTAHVPSAPPGGLPRVIPTASSRRHAKVHPACQSAIHDRAKEVRLLKHTCLILILLTDALANAPHDAAAQIATDPASIVDRGAGRPLGLNDSTSDREYCAGAAVRRLPPCEPISAARPRLSMPHESLRPFDRVRPATFIAPVDLPLPAEAIAPQLVIERSNLAEAVETALERNPNLVALRQTEPVSQAALGVARAYPFNPYAQIQALPLARDRFGGTPPVSHYVLLMQTLELAHQRRFRDAAGTADLTRIQWNIHQAELTNIALTERMFFAAIYQRGVRDLALSLAKLNEDLIGVLDRRFSAGQAQASDLALARLQAHAARQQANLTIATYNTAVLDLRTQLGLISSEPFEPLGDLTRFEWQGVVTTIGEGTKPPANDVLELVSGRPDVMAARADVAFSRANANLARAARVPNLQIGPYYARDDFATVFWGFRSQIDIPVVNNGMPLLRQRMAEVRQREITLEQLQNRAQLEAEAAIERYERARRLIDRSHVDFTRELAEDVRRVESQFQAGQTDLLRVYAARTGLIQAQRALLDTLNELAQAAARVSETTGLPPHMLARPADH